MDKEIVKPKSEWIRIENAHEEIISKQDFNAVQILMNRDTKAVNGKQTSIESQMSILRNYISNKPELSKAYEYVDRGFTGTNFNRPDFKRMMQDVKDGIINCIIVKDLSRFGRDYLETGNYIETILPFMGVRFISVNDHFDTVQERNENKALEIAIKNLVNDMYAKDISKRVSCVRLQEMTRGRFTGSNAPYGYKVDETDELRKFIVDPLAADIVRKIFEMAFSGVKLREVSAYLQVHNYTIPGLYLKTNHIYQESGDEAKNWHIGTISNILKNQAYIGNQVQGKRSKRLYANEARNWTEEDDWIIYENAHEAIIDNETFAQVRKLFDMKIEKSPFSSDRGKHIPIKPDKYLGILYCGTCGKKIPHSSKLVEKNGKLVRKSFYHCNSSYGSKNESCGCYIMQHKLDEIVYHTIEYQVALFIDDTAEKIKFTKYITKYDKTMAEVSKKIAMEEYEGSLIYGKYVTGETTKEEFLVEQKRSKQRLNGLKKKFADQEKYKWKKEKALSKKLKWLKAFLQCKSKADLSRELLECMVNRTFLHQGAEITIEFNFRNQFKSQLEEGKVGEKA